MITRSNIAERLRELRKKAGWSQTQLADAIKIKQRTYATYEEERAQPSLAVLQSLADVYQYETVEEMLGTKKEKKKKAVNPILTKYYSATIEKRKIIDFILNIENK